MFDALDIVTSAFWRMRVSRCWGTSHWGMLVHCVRAIELGVIRFTPTEVCWQKDILINFSVVYECLWRTREFSRRCVVAKIAVPLWALLR
jgi:hypothetical protein